MAWHAGWPLVPTVFTARHLLSHPYTTEPPPTPSQRILLPYIQAYESSLAHTWHELCRGALYEGEDWAGDLAGREEWEVPEWEEGWLDGAREAVEALVIGEFSGSMVCWADGRRKRSCGPVERS